MNEQIALALIYGDDTAEAELWEPVTEEEMYDQDRWTTSFSRVYRKQGTDEYYNLWWTRGSTEYQDVELEWDFNYGAYRVFPYRKVVTEYASALADAQRAEANFQDEILGIVEYENLT